MPLRTRIHIACLVLILVCLAISIIVSAADADRWDIMALGVVVLTFAVAAAMTRRWSAVAVYIVAAMLSVEWVSGVAWSYFRGTLAARLSSYSPLQVMLSFIPAVVYFFLIGYCCYLARRYIAPPTPPL